MFQSVVCLLLNTLFKFKFKLSGECHSLQVLTYCCVSMYSVTVYSVLQWKETIDSLYALKDVALYRLV